MLLALSLGPLARAQILPTVQLIPDLTYCDGDAQDARKHRLDLYRPDIRWAVDSGRPLRPVLVFVHGGGWMFGDKNHYGGLYGNVGRAFAARGYVVAVINYRLSRRRSEVRHPDHVQDVARAVDWVHGHVASYGGDPEEIVLAGHSAGGHLVSLIATDDHYLQEVGLDRSIVRGVVSISGVYDLVGIPGIDRVFGSELEARRLASPLSHIDASDAVLPFLVLFAENDLPGLESGALTFARQLSGVAARVMTAQIADRSHQSIVLGIGRLGDETTKQIESFLERATGPLPPIETPAQKPEDQSRDR